MNRPFAIIGLTYLIALFLCTCFSSIAFTIAITTMIFFIISLFFKYLRIQKTIPIILLTISVASSIYSIFSYIEKQNSNKLIDHDATITGTICEDPIESYGKYYYTIKTDSIFIDDVDNIPQSTKIRISKTTALDCDVYSKITAKIHFYNKDSDGIFSSKNYYAAKGIHNFAYFYEYEDYSIDENTVRPPYYYCIKFKQNLISSLRNLLSKKYYSISCGILLGNKYFIDDEVISNFKNINVSHLLSVSGLHVSIIAQFLLMIFSFFKLSKRKLNILTIIGILFFMAIVGFTSSATRAGIMLIITLLGKILFKSSDSFNSLGIAILILTITNPFAGSDISLLLSVSATLGIILFSDKINTIILSKIKGSENLHKSIKYIINLSSVTLAATLATIPINVFYFKKFSFIAIVSNILMVVPAMISLILSLILSITNLFGILKFISMPMGLINSLIIEYLIQCSNILAALPFASTSTSQTFLLFWIAGSLLIFSIDIILNFNKPLKLKKLPILLSFILLLLGTFSYQIINRDKITLTAVDVGTGCSLVLSKNSHAAVLACGGEDYESNHLKSYLDEQNIKKLDYLVLSDLKEGTSNYSQDVIKKYDPYYVVLPETDEIDSRLSRTIADKSNSIYFTEKSVINLWNNVNITVINSDEQSFLYLNINDIKILVCPSGGNMSYIPQKYKTCNIFIEGVYPEKLDAINSSYIIMSNNKKLTKSKFEDAIKSSKIPMATAEDGSIAIDFHQNKTVSFRRIKI